MIRSLALLVATALLVAGAPPAPSFAEVMPKTLVIGYDGEGSVDTSEASCREFVMQTVEWEKKETDQAVRDVCAARQRHVEAYAALEKAYGAFRAEIAGMPRLDGAAAATTAAQLVKSCIEHKWAVTTGGHNIRLDIVPNEIAVECLDLGRGLLERETAEMRGAR